MKNYVSGLMFSFLMYAPVAISGQCEDLATPQDFTEESAMKAIFCDYNRTHGGTLLPLKYTKPWSAKQAEYLAAPIVAATYRENNARKGVIAIQRQLLENGEPQDSHGQTATLSVYVFKHDGAKWVFEKGKMEAANAGTHGSAPGGELVRLGPEKYGLWFEGGYTGQGYTEDYSFVIALSDPKILQVGNFDTGQENGGTCSDDSKERDEFVHACWSYEGQPEFIGVEGADHYILRIRYNGTKASNDDMDKIVPKNASVCYAKVGEKYQEIKDPKCEEYAALPRQDIFGVSETKKEKQAASVTPQQSRDVELRPAASTPQKQSKALSEEEAISLLVQKVKADSLYADWAKIECLDFSTEETTASHVDVAIYEKHESRCPGDPNTAPVVDRFRVLRSTKNVLWYEPTEGEYMAYERGKAWRKK